MWQNILQEKLQLPCENIVHKYWVLFQKYKIIIQKRICQALIGTIICTLFSSMSLIFMFYKRLPYIWYMQQNNFIQPSIYFSPLYPIVLTGYSAKRKKLSRANHKQLVNEVTDWQEPCKESSRLSSGFSFGFCCRIFTLATRRKQDDSHISKFPQKAPPPLTQQAQMCVGALMCRQKRNIYIHIYRIGKWKILFCDLWECVEEPRRFAVNACPPPPYTPARPAPSQCHTQKCFTSNFPAGFYVCLCIRLTIWA